MASKAARELGEGNRVNVRVRRVGGEDTQAGTCNGCVEVGKGIVAEARGDSAQEVPQAGPDAEADQQVAFIGGIAVGGGRVSAKEQAVKDSDEPKGTLSTLSHRALNKGLRAYRGAKDRVARGNGGSVATEEGISSSLMGGKPGVA